MMWCAEPAADVPTIYLSNWSSHKTPGAHGPGRKFTIMARPREWEVGEGTVAVLMPRGVTVALMLCALADGCCLQVAGGLVVPT